MGKRIEYEFFEMAELLKRRHEDDPDFLRALDMVAEAAVLALRSEWDGD